MSKIGENVTKYRIASDQNTFIHATSSEQRLQLGKRKRESEPIFPRKKSRVKTRVSEKQSDRNLL